MMETHFYTRSELLELRNRPLGCLSALVRRRMDKLYHSSPHWRRIGRGRRAGQRIRRAIPVRSVQQHPRNLITTRPVLTCQPRLQLIYPRLERHTGPSERKLRVGLLNIRSVRNKCENVPDLFDEYRLNVLALTESWHEDSDSVALKRLRSMGLNVIEQARIIPDQTRLDNAYFTNHGGIAIVSNPGTCVAKLDIKQRPTTFELLCCRISGGHSPFIIAVIYRPGSQHVSEQFFSEMAKLLESLATFNCPTWIVGDLNIHLERPTDNDSRKLVQLLDVFKLKQLVREPTHVQGGLLDAIIAPDDGEPHDVAVSEVGLSDHKLIHWSIAAARPRPEYMTLQRRRWSSFNREQFIERLETSVLCRPTDFEETASATELADRYQSVITTILDDLAPETQMSVRIRPHRPYYDHECRQARRTARRLERNFRKWKKKGSIKEAEAFDSWRVALQASRRLVRSKGRQYWRGELESSKLDSKRTWRNLDKLLGNSDNDSRPPSSFSAEDFHQHLDDKINAIRQRTSNARPAEYTLYTGSSLNEFSALSTEEVVAIIRSLPNKQCKLDPLPVWLLKEVVETLSPFLATLLSTSLRTGEFPSSWKHAVVYPHLKRPGSDPAEVANYRPVSNLPFLSKVLERVVNSQVVRYLVSNSLMPRQQSAYRRGHSTETAILRIYNDIVDAVANGQLALLCLLDLSAAFDTVDYDIIIRRLELTYGIKDTVLVWLRDYLTGRSQSVCWSGHTSVPRQVLCGVPQGSVLGPLLFVL